MIAGLLFYGVAVLAGVAAIVRAARLRNSPNRHAAAAQAIALFVLAAALVAMATSTQAAINRHVPDGGKLAGNILTLVAAFASVTVTVYTRYPPEQATPKVRRRLPWLLLAVVVLAVTFFLPHTSPLTGSFDGIYVSEPALAVYTIAYAVYLGVTLADQTQLWWFFSRHAPRFFRWGLRLLAIGAGLGVVYAIAKLAIVVQRLVSGSMESAGIKGVCAFPFSSASCTVAVGAPAVVITVVALGVLACIASARFDNLSLWTAQARSYNRLGPLWLALTTTYPELRRFNEAVPNEAVAPGGRQVVESAAKSIEFRLTRRYVEIRDAMLLLGLTGSEPGADAGANPEAREALTILAALHAKQQDRPLPRPVRPRHTLRDIGADIAWLERVAAQFTLIAA